MVLLLVLVVVLAAVAVALAAWGFALRRRVERLARELPEIQAKMLYTERLRALGDLAASFAHSFNEVLTPIVGRTQLLAGRATDPQEREWLAAVERAALGGAEAVRRIQQFTRVHRDAAARPVDLNALVTEAIDTVRPQLGAAIDVQTALSGVPSIPGDGRGLFEAVTALLVNAVEAMPKGGTLRVATGADAGDVVLTVADTGAGMTAEVKERLFEPFYTTKSDRAGLGLTLAYGVVARHGGQIEVETAPGRGTAVHLHFPAEGVSASRARTVAVATGGDAPPSRCLVVDDDPDVREALRDMLALAGHEVALAIDGSDGVDKFKVGHFDLVVTDLAMPKLNGLQLTRICKGLRPDVPVLMITGWGVVLTEEELAEHGVDAVISKPVRMRELLSTAAGLRGHARAGERKA